MANGEQPRVVDKYKIEYLMNVFKEENDEDARCYGYVHFMANYVVHTMGRKNLIYALKKNKNSTMFDHLTISDEAWIITMLVNNEDCWIHEFESRKIHPTAPTNNQRHDDETQNKENEKKKSSPKPKWTHMQKGDKCQLFRSSWKEEGRQYYAEVYKSIKNERQKPAIVDMIKKASDKFMEHASVYSDKIKSNEKKETDTKKLEEYLDGNKDEIELFDEEGGYNSDAAIDVIVQV